MYVLNYRNVRNCGVAVRIGLRCVPYTLKKSGQLLYKTCFMLNIPEDRSHDDDQVAFKLVSSFSPYGYISIRVCQASTAVNYNACPIGTPHKIPLGAFVLTMSSQKAYIC